MMGSQLGLKTPGKEIAGEMMMRGETSNTYSGVTLDLSSCALVELTIQAPGGGGGGSVVIRNTSVQIVDFYEGDGASGGAIETFEVNLEPGDSITLPTGGTAGSSTGGTLGDGINRQAGSGTKRPDMSFKGTTIASGNQGAGAFRRYSAPPYESNYNRNASGNGGDGGYLSGSTIIGAKNGGAANITWELKD
ncbi:hypothetical protein [uncultured Gilvimarinus sp.]|uniref:hypothetical protein n=1 Tax=uncultured Gilvimarinus sp. TaxID=1689143 RepID=UPI0030EC6F6A|tara:strand:+ start:559 stop:1134 length:576 start_codon:yes stop_codon:yes gene_type:complete